MLDEIDSVVFDKEDDVDRRKDANTPGQGTENALYTTLDTTDLDGGELNVPPSQESLSSGQNLFNNAESNLDLDNQDDIDLLEPFPEINHDRRPKEAGVIDCEDDDNDNGDDDDTDLRPGDHVYVWKSMGFFQTYQKHGIVLSADQDDIEIVTFYHKNHRYGNKKKGDDLGGGDVDDNDRDYKAGLSLLVSRESKGSSNNLNGHGGGSSPWAKDPSSNNNSDSGNSNTERKDKKEPKFTPTVRVESIYTFASKAKSPIRKVKYNQTLAKRLLRRGGTVTSCTADEPALVLARIRYLLETNPTVGTGNSNVDGDSRSMPDFHLMSANGECAAVWCRIGRWCTLQGSSILHILFVGQAGGAVAGGAIASNVMLWAPMPGLWGSVGYVWYVPATIAFPILVPILIGFGLASLVPLEVLRRFRKKWAQISNEMNLSFWAKTDDDVREHYFSSTCSADQNWMKKFFMDDAEKEELKQGRYMPLGIGNIDDDDDTDDEEEEELKQRVAAEYGMGSVNRISEEKFQEQWKRTTVKEKWQNMTHGMNASFGKKRSDKKISACIADSNANDTLPLKDDDGSCREVL